MLVYANTTSKVRTCKPHILVCAKTEEKCVLMCMLSIWQGSVEVGTKARNRPLIAEVLDLKPLIIAEVLDLKISNRGSSRPEK